MARVEDHYAGDGPASAEGAAIARRVLAALRAEYGDGVEITADALAPLDHFHSRGVVATEEFATLLAPEEGEHLLDIGCGIGGPARWFASRFGCRVTGVDLTPAFCEAARTLNAAAGLADRVAILQGSATALPVPDGTFDRAYSQNVVMNIADKRAFAREAFRAVRPGGRVALSNLAAGPAGPPLFPVPWAETGATSFLATPEETRADLEAAGFEILSFRDITAAILPSMTRFRRRVEAEGMPALSLQVLVGPRMREYQTNSTRSMEEGRVVALEILLRRPG